MKLFVNIIFTFIFITFGSNYVLAQLHLPHIFSDHMVLQRDANANIWGWSSAGSKVIIVGNWNTKDTITTITDHNGKWATQISTSQAGGPYTLTIQSIGQQIVLNDILLGDIYLCSGQSNMEWGGNQNLPEIIAELPNANNPNIRLLQVNRIGATTVQENIINKWQNLNAVSLKPFSAIGYFIAQNLNKQTNVPIGIINSSWGGTAAEVWTQKEEIQKDTELLNNAKKVSPDRYRPHETAVLWNAMIAPLQKFNIKGIFWYQGESNVGTWSGYNKLMKTMVNSWRKAWDEDVPFYFVQIAPFEYNNKKAPLAALLREQQSKTAIELPKSGMVVITDLVDNIKDIHPIQKKEVANRLSRMALKDIYGYPDNDIQSPIYKSHVINKDKIEIDFYHLDGSLSIKGKELTDIYIASEDQVFHKAQGVIKGQKLIVYNKEIKKPVAVRFGFTETAMPNLFNEKGLPVSPFRTDNWEFQ